MIIIQHLNPSVLDFTSTLSPFARRRRLFGKTGSLHVLYYLVQQESLAVYKTYSSSKRSLRLRNTHGCSTEGCLPLWRKKPCITAVCQSAELYKVRLTDTLLSGGIRYFRLSSRSHRAPHHLLLLQAFVPLLKISPASSQCALARAPTRSATAVPAGRRSRGQSRDASTGLTRLGMMFGRGRKPPPTLSEEDLATMAKSREEVSEEHNQQRGDCFVCTCVPYP